MNENILEEFVLRVLAECGMDNLSEANKADFVPQYVAEAQRRVGEALIQYLDEEAAKELGELVKQKTEDGEAWWNFWNAKVPNFKEVVTDTLTVYAADMKKVLTVS